MSVVYAALFSLYHESFQIVSEIQKNVYGGSDNSDTCGQREARLGSIVHSLSGGSFDAEAQRCRHR